MVDNLHIALEAVLSGYEREQVVVVVDEQVAGTWQSIYPNTFAALTIRDAENHKSLNGLETIWQFLFDHHITRRGVIVCVGGGAICDLGGFAAATYLRGIDYISIPTTLLSMVDAATGGKTGINYNGLKNAIGAFRMPKATLIAIDWLHTLSTKELLSGWGEMLKTGLLSGTALWNALLQYDIDQMDIERLRPLIAACVETKKQIVQQDPDEKSLRKALNLGHTFGHALEEMGIGTMPHGYAVLYGMIAELYLSVTLLGCPKEPLQQMTQLMLHYYSRPQCNCKDRERLMTLMQQDKKNERADEINCTLLQSIGNPVVNQVITKEQALEAWDYLFSL